MTGTAVTLAALGAQVEWTDSQAEADARTALAKRADGRLADLYEWLAGTQHRDRPTAPRRPRCVVGGPVSDRVLAIADELGVGITSLTLPADATTAAGLAAGVTAADREIDTGADLLVVADPATSTAAALLVGILTDAEPVALLPRGAAAVDTDAWIERATMLRDNRRRIAQFRSDADGLLDALADPALAATAALVLRAVSRRTAVVLDGTSAVAAALLCQDVQPRSGRWWRVADTSPDPVHIRVAEELGQRPLLDLRTSGGDGVAGMLTVSLLRGATHLGVARVPARPAPSGRTDNNGSNG